jgi:hypothetical protein
VPSCAPLHSCKYRRLRAPQIPLSRFRGSCRSSWSYLKRRAGPSLLPDPGQHVLAEDMQETVLVAADWVNEDHIEAELDVLIEPRDVLFEIRRRPNASFEVSRLQGSRRAVEPGGIRNLGQHGGREYVRSPLIERGLSRRSIRVRVAGVRLEEHWLSPAASAFERFDTFESSGCGFTTVINPSAQLPTHSAVTAEIAAPITAAGSFGQV